MRSRSGLYARKNVTAKGRSVPVPSAAPSQPARDAPSAPTSARAPSSSLAPLSPAALDSSFAAWTESARPIAATCVRTRASAPNVVQSSACRTASSAASRSASPWRAARALARFQRFLADESATENGTKTRTATSARRGASHTRTSTSGTTCATARTPPRTPTCRAASISRTLDVSATIPCAGPRRGGVVNAAALVP